MSLVKSALRNFTPHGLIARRRRRLRLLRLGLTPRNDAALEQAVENCHFELWPAFLRQEQGWTLLDVGAHKGDFVCAASMLARPGPIYAFEPNPVCIPALETLLAVWPNSRLVAAAVGAAEGQVEFYCTSNSKMAGVLEPRGDIENSYSAGEYAIARKVTVPLVRLDDVVPEGSDIGLLKLDVQGYEMEALRGASRVLTETKALFVEINYVPHYKDAVDFNTLHGFLNNAGFRLHGISAPLMDTQRHRPLWADAMYVRQDL